MLVSSSGTADVPGVSFVCMGKETVPVWPSVTLLETPSVSVKDSDGIPV